jgi:hypothetical protein
MSLNTIAYVVIMLISIAVLTYILYVKRDIKLVILYMTMSGLIYVFEFIIFVLFNSYTYKPKILNVEYYDSIIGAITSNGFVIPTTLVLIAAFGFRWIGISLAVLGLMGIELLFLYFDVFEHHWWNVSYTAIGLYVFFFIAKMWLKYLRNHLTIILRVATLFFTGLFLHASLNFVISGISQKFLYSIGWFDNVFRDSVAFHTLYNILACFIIAVAISTPSLWIRLSFLTGVLLLSAMDYLLLRNEVLILMGWPLWGFLGMRIITALVLYLVNRYTLNGRPAGIMIETG